MIPCALRRMGLLTALTLVVAACATAGPSPASSSAGSDGAPELAEIRVGTIPIVDVAPVHIAIERGLFEDEGLTVTPEIMQGGAAAIPALQGGDLEIAFGAWPSFLLANQRGIELRAVADGDVATEGFTQFLALPDSRLEGSPQRLAGTTIAVNTLGNIGELATRSMLAGAGVAFEEVTLVEIPFPDMGAALERRSVDVIWVSEPAVTANKSTLGAVTVVDSFIGPMEGFPVAGYMVTAAFAERNPNTVAAFTRAIEAAADLANDPDVVIETVQAYTELPGELAEQLTYPEYRGRLDPASLQRVYDYMLQFDFAEPGLEVESLVLSGS